MIKQSKLKKVADKTKQISAHGIIKLLMADHKLLRTLMKEVKSHKATSDQKIKSFKELKKSVDSHVKAEVNTFYTLIKDNPKFEHIVFEGYEEHRVHEAVVAGLYKVSDKKRKVQQMEIFCEILEQHLDEEEEKLFPRFKKYAALSTRKKIGSRYIEVRKKSNKTKKNRGAARFSK